MADAASVRDLAVGQALPAAMNSRPTIMDSFVTTCVLAVLVESLLGQTKTPLPPTIAEIIRDVREQESAERDSEIRVERTYSLMPEVADGRTETARSQKHILWVSQGNRFRVQTDTSSVSTSGTVSKNSQSIAFDGVWTRVVNSNGESKEPGRHPEYALVRPELFLYPLRNGTTLGNWLEFGEHYGTSSANQSRHEVEFESFEPVGDVACVRVLLSNGSRTKDQWSHRWRFWLAPERGYSIARLESLRWIGGKSVVSAEGKVTKWMNLANGTWIPSEGHVTKYEFGAEDARQPRWTERFVVRSVSLTPKHPDSFFSEYPKTTP